MRLADGVRQTTLRVDHVSFSQSMSGRLPPLTALRAFEAAGRLGSFQAAADALHVTPGAISRQIKALEAELGTALFRREHRRVVLTETGAEFWRDVATAFERLRDASARAAAPARRPVLAVTAFPTFAVRWLIPRWGRFNDRHPEIDLQLATSLATVDLHRDAVDAVVRMGAPTDPDLDSLLLAQVDLFPVANPDFVRDAGPIRDARDLEHLTLIHSAPRPLDWRRWLADAGAGNVEPERNLRFESLNLAFQAAIEGIGIAMGIEALVRADLEAGRLVGPVDHVRRSGRAFHLVWRRDRGRDPRLRAFVDWLADEVGAEWPSAPVDVDS